MVGVAEFDGPVVGDTDVLVYAMDDGDERRRLAVHEHGMSYFDAQMWAAARLSGAALLTEGSQSAPRLDGVTFHNPFAS